MKRKIVPYRDRNENIYDYLDVLVKGGSIVFLDFFLSINRRLRRFIRIKAYKQAILPLLDEAFHTLKQKKDASGKLGLEDLNRFKRLAFRHDFSETQYIVEIATLNDEKISYQAKKNLWEAIVDYLVEIGVAAESLGTALELAYQAPKATENFKAFNSAIDPYFIDDKNHFDGLSFARFKTVMLKTSSLKELEYIGQRYTIKVPKYLNRKQFQSALKEQLLTQNKLTDDLRTTIDKANLNTLNALAKTHQINLSAYISKALAVDFLLEKFQKTSSIKVKTPHINQANVQWINDKIADLESAINRLKNHTPSLQNSDASKRKTRFFIGMLVGFLLTILGFYLFAFFL